MLNFVKVISTKLDDEIRNFPRRLIKYLRLGKNDVRESHQSGPFGTDSNPVKDTIAIYGPTLQSGKQVIIGYINKNQFAEIGEHRIFSTDSDGLEVFSLYLKNDGTAEFGGDADFMVRYNELESAFNELKGDLNSLITAYNSHIHVTTATVGATAVPGILSPTPSAGVSSTADISGAKITEIKTL